VLSGAAEAAVPRKAPHGWECVRKLPANNTALSQPHIPIERRPRDPVVYRVEPKPHNLKTKAHAHGSVKATNRLEFLDGMRTPGHE